MDKVGFGGSSVPASYADAEIKKRLDILRKTKGANVAKTAVARWLLKIVYHILKERRPYVTAYGKMVEAGAAFYFT